jgi:hypothetical protein
MFESTPDPDEETRLIPTEELGQRGNRGIWASSCYRDGEYGVLLGVTQGASQSAAMFIPESRFAELQPKLPKKYLGVFDDAAARLPQFKARMGGPRGVPVSRNEHGDGSTSTI